MINQAIKNRPSDMVISMHLCRGNFRSTFIASGGYEPIADLLFNEVDVDAYFMEWDSDRAGGFEPLRFLPKNKHVVLGLVTSKTGVLETREDLLRRIEEASKFAPLDQLCLSPQCGFASALQGNKLTMADEEAKMRLVVEIANASKEQTQGLGQIGTAVSQMDKVTQSNASNAEETAAAAEEETRRQKALVEEEARRQRAASEAEEKARREAAAEASAG